MDMLEGDYNIISKVSIMTGHDRGCRYEPSKVKHRSNFEVKILS